MVGAIATIVVIADIYYFVAFPLPTIDLGSALIWLAIAYFAGHIVHTISNAIRDISIIPLLNWETKPTYLPHEKRVLEDIQSRFTKHPEEIPADYLWNLCYVFAMGQDGAGQVENFSAYYNLYRGWFTIFLLETIALGAATAFYHSSIVFTFGILSAISTILFYRRTKRFWQYLNDKVFGIVTITQTNGA